MVPRLQRLLTQQPDGSFTPARNGEASPATAELKQPTIPAL